MKRVLAYLLAVICIFSGCRRSSGDPEIDAVSALSRRVLGCGARHFAFERLPEGDKDVFELSSSGDRILVKGNNANSMAFGLNYYLRHFCHTEYGWTGRSRAELPKHLPQIEGTFRSEARVGKRFFLNYCTFGYTMPWWTWKEWERLVDWMALNGINMALAITGQESVWYRVWSDYGMTDSEIRGYFSGPAHLPWHRMINLDRWNGPLPKDWLDGQEALQKRIVTRERELGITPVLPAFSGHVPAELTKIFPESPIRKLVPWEHFDDECACSLLDPMSDLFLEIQKKFIETETALYGSDHVYGIDIFNEVTPPSWDAEYLARVSRQVYDSLVAADPDAVWLQMAWLFHYGWKNWTPERIQAYLTAVPAESQILLDYCCEDEEVWRRTDAFYNIPFIWCYLGNFGGKTILDGSIRDIDRRLEASLKDCGGRLDGIGSTLEGFSTNPYVYEFVFDKAWDGAGSVDSWIEMISRIRTGVNSPEAKEAWRIITDSIQRVDHPIMKERQAHLLRPEPDRWAWMYKDPRMDDDIYNLGEVVRLLLLSGGEGESYRFDLANFTMQWLQSIFNRDMGRYEEAWHGHDFAAADSIAVEMLYVLDDIEEIVGTEEYFLLGKWIADARRWGRDTAGKDYYEREARNIISTWEGKNHSSLNDYARRCYAGMISSYYKVRWERFFDAVKASENAGRPFDGDAYGAYVDAITDYEMSWWKDRIGKFPSRPSGDAVKIARGIYDKYSSQTGSLTDLVDPFIGAAGTGHVFVGAAYPFGMLQPGPTNVSEGWPWCSGYNLSDPAVIGFSMTHLSGTGMVEMLDVTLMPVTGEGFEYARGDGVDPASGPWSAIDHGKEICTPGYYSVPLERFGILSEMTVSERTALFRFSFPQGGESPSVVINLRDGSRCYEDLTGWNLTAESPTLITGHRFSTGWADRGWSREDNQKLWFALEFSRPFDSFASFSDGQFGRVNFNDAGEVLIKGAVSYHSPEGAIENLKSTPGWDFEAVRAEAAKAWYRELSRIRVKAPDKDTERIFYTSMYHGAIYPSLFSDAGQDPLYMNFSLWDTYRAWSPYFTVTHTDMVDDLMRSFLYMYDRSGRIPVWPMAGAETDCMIGNPGIPVAADAILKGFNGFDTNRMYEAMKASAMLPERWQDLRMQYGYIPFDLHSPQSVAYDMEYAIADWAIAETAAKLGRTEDEAIFRERAAWWKHHFDPETGFVRAKDSSGAWREPFDPFHTDHMNDDYCEGNAWQYTWLVPHDFDALAESFGGTAAAREALDRLFSAEIIREKLTGDMTGLIGQYVHGNEPDHHVPYLYTMAGQPWKTADIVREILATLYSATPEGICGNEDMGEMSAWYILSALGFYQVEPCGGRYFFGYPLVDADITLPGDRIFKIRGKNRGGENRYINAVTHNGKPLGKWWIDYKEIMAGGELVFTFGPEKTEF